MNETREIISGRGFLYAPMPFIVMKVTVEVQYRPEKMREALTKIVQAHPTVNDVVMVKNGKMFFVDTGLEAYLEEYTADEIVWEEVIRDVSTRTVDLSKEAGVKFFVVDKDGSFNLIIACHHLVADGLSVKQLMDDLLYTYATGKKVSTREPKVDLCEADLTEECRVPETLKNKLTALVELWEKKRSPFSFDTYKTVNESVCSAGGFGYVHRTIRGSLYRELRGKCKEYDVTVNAALTTAMVSMLQKNGGAEAIIAVSARDMLGYGNNKGIANFSSCLKPYLTYDNNVSFWENTKRIDRDIKEARRDKAKVLETLHTNVSENTNYKETSERIYETMSDFAENINRLKDTVEHAVSSLNEINLAVEENTRGISDAAESVSSLALAANNVSDATAKNMTVVLGLNDQVSCFIKK